MGERIEKGVIQESGIRIRKGDYFIGRRTALGMLSILLVAVGGNVGWDVRTQNIVSSVATADQLDDKISLVTDRMIMNKDELKGDISSHLRIGHLGTPTAKEFKELKNDVQVLAQHEREHGEQLSRIEGLLEILVREND